MEYLLLIAGFIILLYSSTFLIKGSVSIAHKYNVPTLVIGVTVVSFGTSAPELFVSVIAAVNGHPSIAIGNVIGSNIANIALVLAVTAIFFPLPLKANTIRIDWPVMMVVSVIFYIFSLNGYLRLWEGLLFLIFLTAYVFLSLFYSKKEYMLADEQNIRFHLSLPFIIFIIILSIAGLALGSHLLIKNASIIAANLGISERVISISVIAFGTSAPELATSIIAAFKKEMDISVGNIIGSNIFNLLGVLGITSLITPLPVNEMILKVDVLWMLGISILLLLFILPLKKGKLTRIKGAILVVTYCVYIYLLFIKPSL